jgi:diguanylate cyclase (GGDEF)-like protein
MAPATMPGTYNSSLVGLSIGVALLVAYAALALVARVADTSRAINRLWIVGGALAMGIGIWSMHFIAMLAHSLPIPLTYGLAKTAASLVVGIVGSAGALSIVTGCRPRRWRTAPASVVLGGGISGMHYLGMAAIGLVPGILWDYTLVALSVAVAVTASWAALWLAFASPASLDSPWPRHRAMAAAFLCIAICGMHYIGMTAARFAVGSYCTGGVALNTQWLAVVIGVMAIGILGLTLLTAVFDAHLESQSRAQTKALERANAALKHQATHDSLTGLPNRMLLLERLAQASLRAERGGRRLAVLGIDLNDFKLVNDTFGHGAGDALLRQVANRLVECVRKSDTVARFGGDEFVILADGIKNTDDALEVAKKVASAFETPFVVGQAILGASASIGIAIWPDHGRDPEELLSRCDIAMYRAKNQKSAARSSVEVTPDVDPSRRARVSQPARNAAATIDESQCESR